MCGGCCLRVLAFDVGNGAGGVGRRFGRGLLGGRFMRRGRVLVMRGFAVVGLVLLSLVLVMSRLVVFRFAVVSMLFQVAAIEAEIADLRMDHWLLANGTSHGA